MPNYVDNILEIISKEDNPEDIINFIKQHYNKDGLLDFNTFIPEPQSEEECPPRYNFNTPTGYAHYRDLEKAEGTEWFNWYDWRIDHWGTKWNAGEDSKCYYDFDKIKEEYSYFSPVFIHFTTAWTPPIPLFKRMFEMHPELKINVTYHSIENLDYGDLLWGDDVTVNEYRLTLIEEYKLK